ncbi:glycosyltransferase [Parasegetibacter sp. NRK P23]|uniref:glycosyltransferase family protein n=1 Tax=Parasegetibacter sp. NRK P23 TaxID=2942999 RepID=UPI0020437DF8|nr:glycosyltransferase [Parasegetibacter sp. NRK P23]MCM5527632.1 glycosyltransferase [Parasegetibacter sp. NRK P23]
MLKLYRYVKKENPDFIYERAAYLNFSGLIVSKLLRKKHFYELNGAPHFAIRKFYTSFLNGVVRKMEQLAFSKADFLFIVGSWHKVLSLKKENWISIENGIEEEFLSYYAARQKPMPPHKIEIVFIGHLMKGNHNPELLMNGLNSLEDKTKIRLNLAGSQMDALEAFCVEKGIEVVNHGFLNRSQLLPFLERMHVGVIPGGEEYPSFMKIFEYGGSKCLVIAPDLYNLKHWFSDADVLFFKKNDPDDFRKRLEHVMAEKELIREYGDQIFDTIKNNFTWHHIFSQIHSKILSV